MITVTNGSNNHKTYFKITDEVGSLHSLWSIQQTIKLVFSMVHLDPDNYYKLEVPELPWPAVEITAGLPETYPDNLYIPKEWAKYFPF